MGYPHYQSYPEIQSHEFSPPTYPSDYSSHYPSFPSHPCQTYPPEAGDHFSIWSDEDWQAQDTHYYQDQTCPDQHQYQPQPQQSFELPLEENHYANSTEGEIEGFNVSQQNMRSCTRSNDELVMEMQHTYDEQQSNMDEIIRQVALLTDMMKVIQEDRAKSKMNESRGEEEGVREAEEEEPSKAEEKSEALPEKQREVETAEIESDEEESITTPPNDEAPKEILEEAHDEPQEKGEEVIERDVEVDNTLFYLQSRKVHVLDEKVEEFTTGMEGKSAPTDKPPPVIDKSEGCCYEESE